MAITTDEQAVRNALQELTDGQPDAPVDRLVGVRRRHHRRRTLQSAGAALGVAAVVAGGLTVASTVRTTHHQPSIATTPAQPWQLTWPERGDGSVDKQRVLFWAGQQGFTDLRHVRWLYAATAPDGISKWAVFEADFPSDPAPTRADALFTAASTLGGDEWTVQRHDAPPPSQQVLGVSQRTGHAVLALAAPGVDSVQLVDVPREDNIDLTSFPSPIDGAGVITSATGWRAGSTFVRPEGAPSMFAVLFDDDAQVQGRAPWMNSEPLAVHGEHRFGTMAGGAGGGFTQRVDYTGTVIFRVRCAGPVPMRLVVTTPKTSQDIEVDRCDGLFHAFTGPPITRGQKLHTDVGGDQGETLAVISVSVRS